MKKRIIREKEYMVSFTVTMGMDTLFYADEGMSETEIERIALAAAQDWVDEYLGCVDKDLRGDIEIDEVMATGEVGEVEVYEDDNPT